MKKTNIKFWGVRGSLSSPGRQTNKYGGNTPCVELCCGDTIIICDAGTGIRVLGESLNKRFQNKRINATILMSHIHFDHVIGLPFFKPIYNKANTFDLISPVCDSKNLKTELSRLISPPYFPIRLLDVPAKLLFKSFSGGSFKVGSIKVRKFKCNHPGGAYAYKFFLPSKKIFVHITDNEPSPDMDDKLIAWIKDADLLIHDAQYSQYKYKKDKIGWGHSPYLYPVDLAGKAKVKKLLLFHYDPATTDEELDNLKPKLKRYVKKMDYKLDIGLSQEGQSISM